MIEDIKGIKSTKKELKEFGLTIGLILAILGTVALWRAKMIWPYFLGAAGFFIVSGSTFPAILKPLQKIWMAFSIVIGFFVSRLILTILFYFVLTPIGIITKILGKDILDQKIDKNKESYWHDRKDIVRNKGSYENQY